MNSPQLPRLLPLLAAAVFAVSAPAVILLDDDFDAYADGDLAGQGSWTLNSGANAGNGSITVDGGSVLLVPDSSGTAAGNTNVYHTWTPAVAVTDTFFYGVDVTVLGVTVSGDRPTFVATGSGTASNRAQTNFRGWSVNPGPVTQFDLANNGAPNINFDSVVTPTITYRLVVERNASNTIYFFAQSPLDPLTPYYTGGASTGGTINSFSIVIGDIASAGTQLRLDNVVVATTFNEAAMIPEPASLAALAGLAALAAAGRRRRG